MKKLVLLLLGAALLLAASGCAEIAKDTAPLTVMLTMDDNAYDTETVYFIVVAEGHDPDFTSAWLGVGNFTLSSGYGYATAYLPDGSGNPTATQALFEDGERVDIYLVLDADGTFNPAFGYDYSSGDWTGDKTVTITAPGDNGISFVQSELTERL